MGRLGVDDLRKYDASTVAQMSHDELMVLALQALDLARRLANRVDADSSNSSRPPSSDSPYQGSKIEQVLDAAKNPASPPEPPADSAAGKAAGSSKGSKSPKPKRPGKRPGMKGFRRSQPIVASVSIDHVAPLCASCGASLGGSDLPRRCVGAHHVLELERDPGTRAKSGPRSTAILPSLAAAGPRRWSSPARGARASYEGRKQGFAADRERCLVGPMPAVFVAALALRCHMSRRKIQEFLDHWLGLELGRATIDRCIHELGLASEPVVEAPIREVRAADIVHVDETPWYQKAALGWLWVVPTARAVIFRVGDRIEETLVSSIGEAFVGWLPTDGRLSPSRAPATLLGPSHPQGRGTFGRPLSGRSQPIRP